MTTIPVTGYVYQFLLKVFGPGPYDIGKDIVNIPRQMFISIHLTAVRLNVKAVAGYEIGVKFRGSQQLLTYYEAHRHIFERGIFGIYHFHEQMYHQVKAEVFFKNSIGGEGNLSRAVQNFLDRYEIPEDIYSWDNAYMQIMRMQRKYPEYLPA